MFLRAYFPPKIEIGYGESHSLDIEVEEHNIPIHSACHGS